MPNLKLIAALRYAEKYEYSIIPCSPKKKCYIKWQKYQKEKASTEQIKKWWAQWPTANPAIVTGCISGICVIDVDSENGMNNLNQYISESLQMPITKTPSGGKHLWFHANGNCLRNHAGIITDVDFRGEGGYIMAPPSEAWSEHGEEAKFGKYEWIVSIKDCKPPLLPSSYIEHITTSVLYNNIYNGKNHAKPAELFQKGRRDDDLFHVANCLVKGGANHDHIQQVIEILASNCKPPIPKNEAWEKIQSAFNRDERKYKNISNEVREFVMTTSGHFLTTDCHIGLQMTTRREKKTVIMALLRLVEDGIIERYGNRNGCFRLIDTECDKIDWKNAPTDSFDIALPLNLNELVRIMPKNIIVIAGSPDAGKTAFMLNVVLQNIEKHKDNIFYFSSEMVGSELHARLKGFELDEAVWEGCHFYERSANFNDIIRPDAINIIDYFELEDGFYTIGGRLREIHNKLKRGICFVALQKDPNAEWGRGKTFGLEKPRLYLTIDKEYPGQIIKIKKAKIWAHQVNPNGLQKHFKIVNGCKLIDTTNWEKQ